MKLITIKKQRKNLVCWDYLNSPYEQTVAQFTTIKKTQNNHQSTSEYSSVVNLNSFLIPSHSKFQDQFKQSPNQIALRVCFFLFINFN